MTPATGVLSFSWNWRLRLRSINTLELFTAIVNLGSSHFASKKYRFFVCSATKRERNVFSGLFSKDPNRIILRPGNTSWNCTWHRTPTPNACVTLTSLAPQVRTSKLTLRGCSHFRVLCLKVYARVSALNVANVAFFLVLVLIPFVNANLSRNRVNIHRSLTRKSLSLLRMRLVLSSTRILSGYSGT